MAHRINCSSSLADAFFFGVLTGILTRAVELGATEPNEEPGAEAAAEPGATVPDEEPCEQAEAEPGAEAAAEPGATVPDEERDAVISVSLSDCTTLRRLFVGTAVWPAESLSLDMASWTAPHCKLCNTRGNASAKMLRRQIMCVVCT